MAQGKGIGNWIKENQTTAIVGALVVAGFGVLYMFRDKFKPVKATFLTSSAGTQNAPTTQTQTAYQAPTQQVASSLFPLRMGSRGLEVKQLQNSINRIYNAGIAEDSAWGPGTQKAVESYLSVSQVSEAKYNEVLQEANKNNVAIPLAPKPAGNPFFVGFGVYK